MSEAVGDAVTIEIRYLSAVRERTGRRSEKVTFPSGATLADVAAWLNRHYGLVLPCGELMATINGMGWQQVPQGTSARVRTGDVICVFTLVSGG
jgi:molybdopterin converting factor small subunit